MRPDRNGQPELDASPKVAGQLDLTRQTLHDTDENVGRAMPDVVAELAASKRQSVVDRHATRLGHNLGSNDHRVGDIRPLGRDPVREVE